MVAKTRDFDFLFHFVNYSSLIKFFFSIIVNALSRFIEGLPTDSAFNK